MPVRSVAHVTLLLVGLTRSAGGQWAPRTVPFLEGSYSPDRGFVVGGGVIHTRYGFRALPPSTELSLGAAYATETATLRARFQSDFRALLAPTILHVGHRPLRPSWGERHGRARHPRPAGGSGSRGIPQVRR
ncbi:MAG TPA: hypothetical protein VGA20_08785 [Gemmatimonadales bacterium]